MVETLLKELNGQKFTHVIGKFIDSPFVYNSELSPEKSTFSLVSIPVHEFLQKSSLEKNDYLLFYVDASDMTSCLEHFWELKRKSPGVTGYFIVPRDAKGSWRRRMKGMELVHNFLRGQRNSKGVRLRTTLNVWEESSKRGALSAFKEDGACLMTFQGNLGGGNPIKVVLDSAASHSFCKASILRNRRFKICPETMNVKLADGKMSVSQGYLRTKLSMSKINFKVDLHVMELDSEYDVILGNDWLEKNQAVLDFGSGTCRIQRATHAVLMKSQPWLDPLNESEISKQTSILSSIQLKRELAKGSRLLAVILKSVEKSVESEADLAANSPDGMSQSTGHDHPDIASLLSEYSDVFQDIPAGLPPERKTAHAIPMKPGTQPISKSMYRLSPSENREVKRQIEEGLHMGWIQASESPWAAPILFVHKKGGGLRMCIDYRALNKVTIRNQYPLPRIDDMFDSLHKAKYFTSLDLASGYHQIRIPEEDREKTAFRTPFGLFEYKVLSFGLTNAPATFQAAMNEMLNPFLQKFVLVYIDDILIYSQTWEEHLMHIKKVLQKLRENQFYCRQWKCHFGQKSIEYLGHIIEDGCIKVDPKKTEAVQKWPKPTNVSDVRSFLGFCNYFRRFIEGYSSLAHPLTELTKKGKSWEWSQRCEQAFETLKRCLITAPVLRLADPSKPYEVISKPFEVITDASVEGVGAILLQEGHPIAYESKKFSSAERNYTTTEQECLAAYFALSKWRCYLENDEATFTLVTDHHPLVYLKSGPVTSRRQIRWIEFFERFNFNWEHRPGRTNPADPLSRIPARLALLAGALMTDFVQVVANTWIRPPTEIGNPGGTCQMDIPADSSPMQLSSMYPSQTLTLDASYKEKKRSDLLDEIRSGYMSDPWFRVEQNQQELSAKDGLWWHLGDTSCALVVPNYKGLREHIMREAHDALYSGHFGAERTYKTIASHFWWPSLRKDTKEWVRTCDACQRNKPIQKRPGGMLQNLSKPDEPWTQVGIDLIVGLPMSSYGHDAIIVFVDHLTKMVHFVPTTGNCSAMESAKHFVENVFRLHGLPKRIISDREPRFLSAFWKEMCRLLHIEQTVSTSFHPETGGQTERNNRILEDYLRNYVSPDQLDWDQYLFLAEFAMNNAYNYSTGMTAFQANQGWQPLTPLTEGLPRAVSPVPVAEDFRIQWQQRFKRAKQNLLAAQSRYKSFADLKRREVTFKVGDKVMLSTKNVTLKTTGVRKLLPRWIGPFKVVKVVNPVAYKLELPPSLRIHPVFHVSLLKVYHEGGRVQPPPPPEADEEGEIYEVEAILAHREVGPRKRKKTQYLIKWLGYGPEHNTWEPEENVQGSPRLLREYWRANR